MEAGRTVVSLWVEQAGPWWFGVADHDGRLVATAIGGSRDEAARSVARCVPARRGHRFSEEGSEYQRAVVRLLARLEAGEEDAPRFELCPDCVPRTLAAVLRAAAAIPRGYVSTYGAVAAAADTEARVVGRVMATNPLYPIVACHRVVGGDFSLVGYSGRQDTAALRAKLGRLRREAKGFPRERVLDAMGGLAVYPVERVIRKAAREGVIAGAQLTWW
jgi:O-6-methylguanine DNA methyltransferase